MSQRPQASLGTVPSPSYRSMGLGFPKHFCLAFTRSEKGWSLTHQDILVSFSEFSEGLSDLLPRFGLLEVTVHRAIFLLRKESHTGSQPRAPWDRLLMIMAILLLCGGGQVSRDGKASRVQPGDCHLAQESPSQLPSWGVYIVTPDPWPHTALGSLGGVRGIRDSSGQCSKEGQQGPLRGGQHHFLLTSFPVDG